LIELPGLVDSGLQLLTDVGGLYFFVDRHGLAVLRLEKYGGGTTKGRRHRNRLHLQLLLREFREAVTRAPR
jgi:hypothetical protein